MNTERHDSPHAWIPSLVTRAVVDSAENALRGFSGETAWAAPLVGFAAGDDPLFAFLKKDIGGFYWTPEEIFNLTFPEASVGGSDLSVVSWVLPQVESTKRDHRRETRYPARRWESSRAFWPEMTRSVHQRVVDDLAARGIAAVAPEMSPLWSRRTSETYGFASNWSHRHTAYVAGLGTFGLSDGLITPVGKAMRCGSMVIQARIDPTPRMYTDHHGWCPFYRDGSCGECITRCPAGAITPKGHDKIKCERYISEVISPRSMERIGERTGGCGLCQVGVACESGTPA